MVNRPMCAATAAWLAQFALSACGSLDLLGDGPAPPLAALGTRAVVGEGEVRPFLDPHPLDRWNMAYAESRYFIPLQNDGNTGIGDYWRTWAVRYDTEMLYAQVYVADRHRMRDSEYPWEDDAVEIFIDGDGLGGDAYDGKNDLHYVVRVGAADVTFGLSSKHDARGVQVKTTEWSGGGGYDLTIAVPWSTIGVAPTPGHVIGFDVHVDQDDDGGGRDARFVSNRTDAQDAWTKPSVLSRLKLGRFPALASDVRGVVDTKTEPEPETIDLWSEATPRPLFSVLRGSSGSRSDASAYFLTGYSAHGLLVQAVVQDDLVVSDSEYPWEDDSVEFYLDGDDSKGASYDGLNDYQLVVRLGDPTLHLGTHSATDARGIEVSASPSEHGEHRITVLVPWARLGVTAREGMSVGIDVHVNDDDDGGNAEGKLAGFSDRDDAWQNPVRFGTVRLGSPTEVINGHRFLMTTFFSQDDYVFNVANAALSLAMCEGCQPVASAITNYRGYAELDGCKRTTALISGAQPTTATFRVSYKGSTSFDHSLPFVLPTTTARRGYCKLTEYVVNVSASTNYPISIAEPRRDDQSGS